MRLKVIFRGVFLMLLGWFFVIKLKQNVFMNEIRITHGTKRNPNKERGKTNEQKECKSKCKTQECRTCELCSLPKPENITLRMNVQTYEEIETVFPDLDGIIPVNPSGCIPRQKVALVVPYRNRETQLNIFLFHMHKFFHKQKQSYGIFIIQPQQNETFNRAKLLNVGFVEALKAYDDFDCFIFHDVDLLSENYGNAYLCDTDPKQLGPMVRKVSLWSNYRRRYQNHMGGAVAVTKEAHERVNGFSNEFWGWGLEDDDYSKRLRQIGHFGIMRTSSELGRQTMLEHVNRGEAKNPFNYCRTFVMKRSFTNEGWKRDGLSTLSYSIIQKKVHKTHHHIIVDLHEAESMKKLESEDYCQKKNKTLHSRQLKPRLKITTVKPKLILENTLSQLITES